MSSPDDPREVREERRVITAVFADLVGSTVLAERLDPEELKVIVGDALARMIGAVESFGGTIKDLAGDGVLALFGAPAAHEDDPERAVRAVAADRGGDRRVRARGRGRMGRRRVRRPRRRPDGAGRRRRDRRGEPRRVLRARRCREHGGPPAGARRAGAGAGRGADVPAGRAACSTGARDVVRSQGEVRPGRGSRGAGRDRDHRANAGPGGRAGAVDRPRPGARRRPRQGRTVSWPARAASCSSPGSRGSARRGYSPSCTTCSTRVRLSTAARCGWRAGACRTGSPCRTGRSATSCGPGSASSRTSRSCGSASRSAGWSSARSARARPSSRRTSAALLGLTLEPDAAKRLAELSPEALQYRTFEVVRELISRLTQDGPVAVALEDLHWADATSLQLLERLFADTEPCRSCSS